MRRNGFSLVEMVIAAALLGGCLIPVIGLSHRGLTEAESTREGVFARQALMDLCERYKAEEPAELARIAADPTLIERDALLQPVRANLRRTVTFTPDLGGVTGLHEVVFEVSWSGRRLALHRLVHAH